LLNVNSNELNHKQKKKNVEDGAKGLGFRVLGFRVLLLFLLLQKRRRRRPSSLLRCSSSSFSFSSTAKRRRRRPSSFVLQKEEEEGLLLFYYKKKKKAFFFFTAKKRRRPSSFVLQKEEEEGLLLLCKQRKPQQASSREAPELGACYVAASSKLLEFSAAQTGGERRICTLKTVNGHKPIKNHNMHHPLIFCEEAKKKEIQLSVFGFHHSTNCFLP
jgi:hypothetical protein